MSTSRRGQRVSGRQVDMLWEFLNSHRDVASSFNRSLQAKEYSQRRWRELAGILNAQGEGAHKDGKGWCKYWVDYKAKIKSRVAALRSSQRRTGGGPSTEKPLTEIEEKFLQILGEDFGQGLSGVRVDPFTEPLQSDTAVEETDVQGSEFSQSILATHIPLSPFQLNFSTIEPHEVTPDITPIQEPSQSPIRPLLLSPNILPRSRSPIRPPPTRSPTRVAPQPLPSATPPAGRSPRHRSPRRVTGRRRREHPLSLEAARRALVRDSQLRAEAAARTSTAIERMADCMEGLQNSLTRIERVLDAAFPRAAEQENAW